MDLKSIKNKLSALQTSGQKKEKVDYSKYLWKPKQEGKYQIRIVPSKFDKNNYHASTQHERSVSELRRATSVSIFGEKETTT